MGQIHPDKQAVAKEFFLPRTKTPRGSNEARQDTFDCVAPFNNIAMKIKSNQFMRFMELCFIS